MNLLLWPVAVLVHGSVNQTRQDGIGGQPRIRLCCLLSSPSKTLRIDRFFTYKMELVMKLVK